MANYEYECELDGIKDHQFLIGTAPDTIPCAICGDKMKRNYSNFGIVLRGTGWGRDK
jgi:predicted nucleic acid-binding Zn ribbon protein